MGTILTKIKLLMMKPFWWSVGSEEPWQCLWKQYLDVLQAGGLLDADPGTAEAQEYLTAQLVGRYGSFRGLKILGAGCGTGRIEAWLGQGGAEVVCLDHIVEALEVSRIHAQRGGSDGHFAVGDLIRMPFVQDSFDCVFSGGVLEHFQDPSLPLAEFFRITKPGGVIIVSVPNLLGVNAIYGYKPLTEPIVRRFTRLPYIEQDFSATRFRKLIEAAGFECLDISPTLFNVFANFPFKYMRGMLSGVGLFRASCRVLKRFGRRFPGIAPGYSFMIATAQKKHQVTPCPPAVQRRL